MGEAPKLGRAAWLGLTGGLFAGGLMLLGFAARALFFPPVCPEPVTAQCGLEGELSRSFAWRQSLFGGLLCLLALSAFSLYRQRRRREREQE